MKKLFAVLTTAIIAVVIMGLAVPANAQSKKKLMVMIQQQNKVIADLKAENAKMANEIKAVEELRQEKMRCQQDVNNLLAELEAAKNKVIKDDTPASAQKTKTNTGEKEKTNATAKPKPPAPLKPGQVKYDPSTMEAVCLPNDTLAAENIRLGFTKKEDKAATRTLKKGQFLEDYSAKEYRHLASDTEMAKNYPVPSGFKEGTDPR